MVALGLIKSQQQKIDLTQSKTLGHWNQLITLSHTADNNNYKLYTITTTFNDSSLITPSAGQMLVGFSGDKAIHII